MSAAPHAHRALVEAVAAIGAISFLAGIAWATITVMLTRPRRLPRRYRKAGR